MKLFYWGLTNGWLDLFMYIHNDNTITIRTLGFRINGCITIIFNFLKQCEG